MPPTAFLAMLVTAAQACQRATGIPASFTLAQAALESGWGSRAPGNNLFGIKADKAWKGPTVDVPTHEVIKGKRVAIVDKFRAYPTLAASIADRADFFRRNPRYAACFKETTGEGWARAVAAAGYATDPKYAETLVAVMRGRRMSQYDQLPEVRREAA
ncbi:glucosaminidase domain-containing protein [Massilia sp.]|uniref:glycoside hydrolase family 73 protein n=1 Tax=Massilia sp. TaxID=1882437 RepID=UPI0028A0D2BE|nr:glucosaminidase domain-containing protein [Massilia sp.]